MINGFIGPFPFKKYILPDTYISSFQVIASFVTLPPVSNVTILCCDNLPAASVYSVHYHINSNVDVFYDAKWNHIKVLCNLLHKHDTILALEAL